jgi:signal transduction histidine kinase
MPPEATATDPSSSVASVPSTPRHRRLAIAAIGLILTAFAAVYPFALLPLRRVDGFIPGIQALICATDLITAILLYGQYAVARSRAVILLASGYLFSGLIVLAQTVTFPGAFSPTGLLGAGPQTAAWLYFAWHFGFPAAVVAYALAKDGPGGSEAAQRAAAMPPRPSRAIGTSVLVVVAVAGALTAAAILGSDFLPALVVTERTFAPLASLITTCNLLAALLALGLLWSRRASILDDWLMVAVCALIAEAALATLVGATRFTLAFYASRVFAFVVSSSVLAAMIWETTRLYARLSRAVRALQRERSNKLLNLEAMIASVAHEIKQPLTVIATRNGVVKRLLAQPVMDIDRARKNLDEMESASLRVSETFENIRALFRNPSESRQPLDVNEVVRAALALLDGQLRAHRVVVDAELPRGLPRITGHAGQLQEVFVNMFQNAIDAMDEIVDRTRKLTVTTQRRGDDEIAISIDDTGHGIEPQRLPNIFDALTTTKSQGTGLGLGICRMIVEHHAGRLAVSSELGKGTRFEIALPLARGNVEEPAADTVEAPQIRSLKSRPYVRGSA